MMLNGTQQGQMETDTVKWNPTRSNGTQQGQMGPNRVIWDPTGSYGTQQGRSYGTQQGQMRPKLVKQQCALQTLINMVVVHGEYIHSMYSACMWAVGVTDTGPVSAHSPGWNMACTNKTWCTFRRFSLILHKIRIRICRTPSYNSVGN